MRSVSFWPAFFALVIILAFGLSTVWSTAPALVTSQIIALCLGIIAAVLVAKADTKLLFQLRWPAYLISVSLLILTEILGITTRGSTRWIDLGSFHFQTSEFIKPLLIIAFAAFVLEEVPKSFRWVIKQLVLMAIPIGLIFAEPDLGSALSLLIIWFGIVLSSPFPKKYLLLIIVLGSLVTPLAINFLKPYQRERLESFINPFADPAGSGYNVIQAMIAVGSGQTFGKGVRQGTQSQLRFLPERQTDFAFASFAEEYGFMGVTIMLVSFGIFLNWILAVSEQMDQYPGLIAKGYFWWIFGQMIINIGMNMGIMPVTGITLPWVSYGGSSLLSLCLGLGLVLASISEKRR